MHILINVFHVFQGIHVLNSFVLMEVVVFLILHMYTVLSSLTVKYFSVDILEQSFSVFRLGQSIVCTCLFVLMWMLFI